MKKLVFLLCLLLAIATTVHAQTVPGPRVSVAFDPPMSPTCENPTGSFDAWTFTYGVCYKPASVNLGDPFLTGVRVTFTGATTVSSTIPRGQVVRETTAARCLPGPAPCYRINDLPAPAGPSTLTLQFVDGENRAGTASAGLPFTGSSPGVPAMTGARLPTAQ